MGQTWRRALVVAATVLLAAASALVGAQFATGQQTHYPGHPDNPLAFRGCVIRFDERTPMGFTRPRVHENATHYNIGCDDVYADHVDGNGDLVIETNTQGPIVSLWVSPDETLTARGIDCGASGGGGITRVRCWDRDGNQVKAYSSALYGQWSNVWVGFVGWWPGQ